MCLGSCELLMPWKYSACAAASDCKYNKGHIRLTDSRWKWCSMSMLFDHRVFVLSFRSEPCYATFQSQNNLAEILEMSSALRVDSMWNHTWNQKTATHLLFSFAYQVITIGYSWYDWIPLVDLHWNAHKLYDILAAQAVREAQWKHHMRPPGNKTPRLHAEFAGVETPGFFPIIFPITRTGSFIRFGV
jgi:hypothetical protein